MNAEMRSLLGIPSPAEQRTMALLGLTGQRQAAPPASEPMGYPDPATDAGQRFQDYYTAYDQPGQNGFAAPDPFPTANIGQGGVNYRLAQQHALHEQYANDALTKLAALDPADPDHLAQQEAILTSNPLGGDLLRDPRVKLAVGSSSRNHGELQHLFSGDPQAAYDYAHLKQSGKTPAEAQAAVRQGAALRQAQTRYVERGGDPVDMQQFVHPESGAVDWPSALFHLEQQKGDELTQPRSGFDKEMAKLGQQYQQLAADPLSSEDGIAAKRAWIQAHNLKEDEAGWAAAHEGVMAERTNPIRAKIGELAQEAEERRYVPNNHLREIAGLPAIPVIQDRRGKLRIDRKALAAPKPTTATPPQGTYKTASGNTAVPLH
jgi:hypothetical protein